jgi:hypothetical protein
MLLWLPPTYGAVPAVPAFHVGIVSPHARRAAATLTPVKRTLAVKRRRDRDGRGGSRRRSWSATVWVAGTRWAVASIAFRFGRRANDALALAGLGARGPPSSPTRIEGEAP